MREPKVLKAESINNGWLVLFTLHKPAPNNPDRWTTSRRSAMYNFKGERWECEPGDDDNCGDGSVRVWVCPGMFT